MRRTLQRIAKRIITIALVTCMILPLTAVDTHAEIFYLQTGRRFDSDFYANYYPDLKAKYGYNAHKLLDHYINYGIFERRIPSAYYINNMDALGIGDYVPDELLYNRKSLRKGMSLGEFKTAYSTAYNRICVPAKAAFPNRMDGQMAVIAQSMYNWINFSPGVKYNTNVAHYNDPGGVLGWYRNGDKGVEGPFYGASSAGATRAVGLCLNILAIPYEHVNENTWKHQFVRVRYNNKYYVIDPYVSPSVMEETYYVRLYPPYMW